MVPVDLIVIPAVFVVVFFDKLRPGDGKSFLFGLGLLLLDAPRATFAVLDDHVQPQNSRKQARWPAYDLRSSVR
jgi:hypothetical protein